MVNHGCRCYVTVLKASLAQVRVTFQRIFAGLLPCAGMIERIAKRLCHPIITTQQKSAKACALTLSIVLTTLANFNTTYEVV